jgi:hypothetical protein
MDRMETKHEDLAKEVATLTATTGQVVLNQQHGEELNTLRFKSLDGAVAGIGTDLKGFMTRMEGIISGEVTTTQGRAGQEMVADFVRWRKETDARLTIIEDVPTLITRVDSLEDREMRRKGVIEAFSGIKGILLMVAAVASPLIAAAAIILSRPA